MRREPAFTATALLALGSGIGVNTSVFTVFNAFALQTWAVRDPGRVVTIRRFTRHGAGDFGIAQYRYLAGNSHTLSGCTTGARSSLGRFLVIPTNPAGARPTRNS